jgi:hypothetical protein
LKESSDTKGGRNKVEIVDGGIFGGDEKRKNWVLAGVKSGPTIVKVCLSYGFWSKNGVYAVCLDKSALGENGRWRHREISLS